MYRKPRLLARWPLEANEPIVSQMPMRLSVNTTQTELLPQGSLYGDGVNARTNTTSECNFYMEMETE